jgi:hypothetical protein
VFRLLAATAFAALRRGTEGKPSAQHEMQTPVLAQFGQERADFSGEENDVPQAGFCRH